MSLMFASILNWLGALLSGPAANLLSGLIGAIVGVVGLFLIRCASRSLALVCSP